MYPTLFTIGSHEISSYSIMVLIAYLIAYVIAGMEIKRRGLDDSITDWLLLATLFGGLGGAKLVFLIQNATLAQFFSEPLRYLSSGLTFYGGLIGAFIFIYAVGLWKKVSFWTLTDCTAPVLVLGYGIGRIGCLLVGDDYGIPTDVPWALSFPKGSPPTFESVHPTQIYDTISMTFVFIFMWSIRKYQFPSGWLFSLMLMLIGFERFFVEFIRNTTPSFIEGLSQAQVVSIIIFVFGSVNLLRLKFFYKIPSLT